MSKIIIPQTNDINPVCGERYCNTDNHGGEVERHFAWSMSSGAIGREYSIDVWKYVTPEDDEPTDWNVSVHVPDYSGASTHLDELTRSIRRAQEICALANGARPATGPGSSLRHLRDLAGLSRRELAVGMGYRPKYRRFIKLVETGERVMTAGWYGAAAEVCAAALGRPGRGANH